MFNHSPSRLDRRGFLTNSALAVGGLSIARFGFCAKEPDPYGGFKMGLQSYSLRAFDARKALEHTQQLGVRYWESFPKHIPLSTVPEIIKEEKSLLDEFGVTLMAYGVVGFDANETKAREIFDFAKAIGLTSISANPEKDAPTFDLLDKLVEEYDIPIAIHNHGPGDKYYPLPFDAWRMVENRDKRMGLCIDVGHTVRIGGDPIAAIKRCASRLYDFHLKDVTAAVPTGKHCVFGKGVIDFPRVLQALLDVKFAGHLEIEYEDTPENPLPGMKESMIFLRKVFAQLT